MIDVTHTIEPEWQNSNALRAYPISDDAPAASAVPTWIISDLHIAVADTYHKVHISSIYVSDTLISVGIGALDANNNKIGLLTCTVTRDELEPDRTYSMNEHAYATGEILFGTPPYATKSCKFIFDPDDAPIVESAIVRIKPPGVTKLIDPIFDTVATNVIDLSGNTQFLTYQDPEDPQMVVIKLDDTYRDLVTSICNSTPSIDTCGETPVRTINGVPPNANGRVFFRFR